jgi:hypothetical protein
LRRTITGIVSGFAWISPGARILGTGIKAGPE